MSLPVPSSKDEYMKNTHRGSPGGVVHEEPSDGNSPEALGSSF